MKYNASVVCFASFISLHAVYIYAISIAFVEMPRKIVYVHPKRAAIHQSSRDASSMVIKWLRVIGPLINIHP